MRMLTNKTDYDCGPIAVMNAVLIKTNFPLDYKEIKRALKTTKTGTHDDDIEKVLQGHQILGYDVIHFKHPSRNLKKIKALMDKKNTSVILSHLDHFGEWHCSVWEIFGGAFVVCNLIYGDVRSHTTFKNSDLFDHLCKKKKDGESPVCWVLTKR